MPINWGLNCEMMNALLFTFLQVCLYSNFIRQVIVQNYFIPRTVLASFKIEMFMSCRRNVSTEYLLLKAPIILPKRCSCLGVQSQISPGEFKYPQLLLQLLLSQQLLSAAPNAAKTAARRVRISWAGAMCSL